jgi:hypothetical protein
VSTKALYGAHWTLRDALGLMGYRELRVISQKMRPSLLGASKGRRVFSNRTDDTGADVVASANEFSLVLDRFQVSIPLILDVTYEFPIFIIP